VVEQQYFQIELKPPLSPAEYLFDLDVESVIRDVLVPIHVGEPVFIRGRETPGTKVVVRIIVTDRQIQPELRAWFNQKGSAHLHDPKAAFVTETCLFDIERDVTNAMFHRFREASQWQQIQALLKEATAARTRYADAGDPGEKSSASALLRQLSADIAHLGGAFLAGYQRW
jgi:hypothetical protein